MQVRGGDDPFDVPMYVLCRRWVRNDPENDEAAVPAVQVCFCFELSYADSMHYAIVHVGHVTQALTCSTLFILGA